MKSRLSAAAQEIVAQMLDVRCVATMLGCSPRHVYRLVDVGRMPPPVRLGSLVRWPRATVEQWIAMGCPEERSVHR